MADSALGAALTIPKSALDAIEQADKKLKDIQDTAKNTASSVTQSFKDMSVGTKPFLDSLDQVIAKLATINASASNASSGISNVGASAGNMNNNITSAAQNIQNMVAQLSKMNGSGTSGIMQAALAFQRLQESAKGASGMNIAELKQEIGSIESMLRDTTQNLTKADQDALIKRKKSLQDELRYQQQMYNERAVAFQKALDKMVSAEQSYNNKQRKAYADRAKDYQTRNNKANTTYQGALDFSATANTLNRQVRAIEYLKEARMKLSQTDADYKRKLDILNAAIEQHNKNLKEAGVNSRALTEQTSYMAGYMSRWAQRMAFTFSFGAAKSFVGQIAEVRGQFELSERSLEAILQNKPKADEIFNKTVELAVKSPFRIKDLVDYTRQLSAYRIESDKLYDTTKRLADVSAGLGVDMGRLILAYGQVKAAAYLRGSEVRQFTEAGINMYGELQQYFKEVKGEAYTTAQIVDMISKRKVTFEDVEAIFQRMTDKGGTFYNMQEIQAETLQGKISNLKDAFDVMLNDIGKRWDGFLKGSVSLATSMLNYWNLIGDAIGSAVVAFITYKALSLSSGNAIKTMMGNWKALRAIIASTEGVVNKVKAATTLLSGTVRVMKSLLTGIAVMALYDLSLKVYESFANYDKAIEESNENTAKLRGNVNSLSLAYDKLKSSSQKANKEQNKADNSIVTKKRAELQALVDEANKNGYIINIDVKTVEASKLDKIFDTLKAKYQNFITYIQLTNEKFAKDEQWDWLPGQNSLKDVVDKYNEAATNVMSHTNKIDNAINVVKENYDEATVSTKKWFDAIMQGRRQGESDLSYYSRMTDAINHINLSMQNPSWLKTAKDGISSIIQSFAKMMEAEKDAKFYFKEVFGDAEEFKNKYGNDPQIIKYAIDKTAADKGWGDFVKEMLYKTANTIFHVKIKEDKASIEETATTIHDQLQRELDKRKVNIKVESLYNSPLHNYVEDAEKLNKSLQDYQDDLKYMAQHPKKYYLASELMAQGMDLSGLKTTKGKTVTGNDYVAPKYVKEYILKQMAELRANGAHSKQDDKDAKNNAKEQRDILSERISLLKEMNKQYEQLDKYMDDDSAAQSVMKHYAANLKYVGMPNKVVKDFVPDKQGLIQALKQIEPTIKDFKKRAQLKNDIVELQIQLDTEFFQQQLNDVKNEISKSFDQLNLYKKLQGEGLSDGLIKSMFGDLTSSFDDVRKGIEDQFTAKFGNNTKWSSDIWKQYQEQMDKLDKEVYQDQVNQAQELIKAYKQQLTDQLQLDKWYIEEKQKIQNNANITKNKDLQKQLQDNLDKQYASKTDSNSWKDFQNSDMYISIFENLDHTSNRVLTAMKARLEGLRSSLKNLTPEQLKQIVEQINKIDALLVERNPYSNIGKNFKEYLKFAKQRKKLEEEYIDATQKEQILKNDQSNANKDVQNAEIAYNNAVKKYGVASKEAIQARILWDIDKERLRTITDQLVAQGKITEKQAEQIRNGQKLQKTLQQQVQTIGQNFSDAASSVTELFDALNDWGANIEMSDEMSEVVDGISKIGSSLESIDITRPFSIVKGTIGVIGGIGKTIGGIFGWGTKDKKLQKQIENHQKAIEKLRERYSELKDAMDNAFDIERLAQYNDEMVKNLKTQNANLESMIKAEQDKKKTDNDKIEEYRKQIEANNKAIEEAEKSLTEQLGGFGTKANYKSAAEEFAKTWVDAYNEGCDALEALNDKFDEYIQNLIVKQATQRIVGNMVEPLLKKIDNAVKQGSEGGNNGLNLVKAELDDIMTTGKDKLKGVSDMLKSFVDGLGYKPKGSSNISALQQGIQSVTESTAQALESILNSCRWYIATQQADIRIIRDTLLEKLGNSIGAITQDTSSSPVLIELRLQTTILTDIRDTLASCVKGGHKQGRNGIKVFMN
ncbi:tape measure protein [Leyella stercorea]|uniref:tape measure protein n=2 Tax=Bacteria TaxID=2 RepID=UPI00242D4816|nr:tape measure protein [Leyella stercorea]